MKFSRFLSGLPVAAVVVLVLAVAPEARAAIFLCNADIPGDSVTQGFEGCSDVLSFGEAIELPVGTISTGYRSTSQPTAQPFRVVKSLDSSSPVWRDKLISATTIANDITIKFTVPKSQGPQTYFEVTLVGTLVTAISMSTDGNGVPVEVISLEPLQVDWTFTPFDSAGNAGSPVVTSWSITGIQ